MTELRATFYNARRAWLLRAALAGVSAYLALLAAQTSLPVVLGLPVRVPFDTPFVRSTVEIASELQATRPDASVLVYPGIWLDHDLPDGPALVPLGGLSRRLTVFCEEQHNSPVTYTSDQHGFRNDAHPWESELGLAAIGDSFTQGACVERNRGFIDLIGEGRGALLNLGMSGDGPLMELATLKEYVPARVPRLVLWFFYPGNDLFDLDRERRNMLLIRYLEDGFRQHLVDRQEEIDRRVAAWLDAAQARFTTGQLASLIDGEASTFDLMLEFFGLRALRRLAASASPPDHDFALLARVMGEARRTVDQWGGQLVFVYLPDHITVPRLPAAARADRDKTVNVVRSLQIPIIDVESETRSVKRSDLFYNSTSHYSGQGNTIVADITRRNLAALER